MRQVDSLQIVYLLGCLVLVGSALGAYRLKWRSGLVMALAWVAIFAIVFLFIDLVKP